MFSVSSRSVFMHGSIFIHLVNSSLNRRVRRSRSNNLVAVACLPKALASAVITSSSCISPGTCTPSGQILSLNAGNSIDLSKALNSSPANSEAVRKPIDLVNYYSISICGRWLHVGVRTACGITPSRTRTPSPERNASGPARSMM